MTRQIDSGISPSEAGLELRLGYVGRENARTKAARYLLEGRVVVRHVDATEVRAQVRGREIYTVEHAPGRGWDCTCPARGRCAHIIACSNVTARGESDE